MKIKQFEKPKNKDLNPFLRRFLRMLSIMDTYSGVVTPNLVIKTTKLLSKVCSFA